MKKYAYLINSWFAYAVIVTLLCGIVLIVVQQNYRLTANDPQYQLAEDAANALNNGADPKSLVNSAAPVEISKSLSPFLVIYDKAGNIAASNATLNGKTLQIPAGVIAYIQLHGSDAASWQPQGGVRQAMVGLSTDKDKGYTVTAGRSLRKVEERIGVLGEQVAFGWFCSLIALAVLVVVQDWVNKKLISPANEPAISN